MRIGPLATGIDGTARLHHQGGTLHDGMHRHQTCQGKSQTRCHPLHNLCGFEHATIGCLPTAQQQFPMRNDQPEQFGIHLRQDTLRLVTAPGIELAMLFPQLPQQFDLPTAVQQHERFQHREQRLRDSGQHDRPIG